MKGRATTLDEKKEIARRILTAWTMVPDLRLGQFISNAISAPGENADPFHIEDETLAEACEAYAYPRRKGGAP